MNVAVVAMRGDQSSIRNTLHQYTNDFLIYGKYNVKTLDKVIETVNTLHQRQTEIKTLFSRSDLTFPSQSIRGQMLDTMLFNFDVQLYLTLTEEEHVNQYSLLEAASKDLLGGIATLGQGRLPQELVPNQRLKAILKEVQAIVKTMLKLHSGCRLYFSLQGYEIGHICCRYRQSPLAMYEICSHPYPQ